MKKIKNLTAAVLILCLIASPIFVFPSYSSENSTFLYDGANTLTSSEESCISKKLENYSNKHSINIAIYTEENPYPVDAEYYAENVYSKMNYPYSGGILLYLSNDGEGTDWYMLPKGSAYSAFNDDAMDDLEDEVIPLLANGEFKKGYERFAEICSQVMIAAENGEVYKGKFDILPAIIISAVIGIAVGLISVSIMKASLKSVRAKKGAAEYTRSGSMNVTHSRDIYLYSTVTRTAKPKSSSSGGRSRGGGRGGRF